MRKTFCSFTFGCRVNIAETEALNNQLLEKGFSFKEKSPTIFIINSCAVTQKAEREVKQFIYQTKRKFPDTKIIVTGCAATKWVKENLQLKEVDWLVENKDKESLPELLVKRYCFREVDVGSKTDNLFKNFQGITDKYLSSGRLFVKIQEGCQRFCTYCLVPYLRGKPRSKKISEIIAFIKKYEGKIQEVILTAVNTEAFGLDTGESFVDLIDQVIKKTKIPRVSLGSLHPWSLGILGDLGSVGDMKNAESVEGVGSVGSVGQNFFIFYEKILPLNRFVNYFHIPLQSGSNKILRLMKRGYSKEEFFEKILALEKINPMAFIAIDIIVGFLDETQKDFEETYQFLKKSPISKFHIFKFSKREKTAAFYLAKKFEEPTFAEKAKRTKILALLSKEKYEKFLQKHLGKTFPALFLQKRVEDFQEALLNNQIQVWVKTNKHLENRIKNVKVEKYNEGKLFGRLV